MTLRPNKALMMWRRPRRLRRPKGRTRSGSRGKLLPGQLDCHACMHTLDCMIGAQVRDVVTAKDFSRSAFNVTMDRCQQRALEHANMSVPDPARQLELLSMRRVRGKRGGPAKLRFNIFLISSFAFCHLPVRIRLYLRNYVVDSIQKVQDWRIETRVRLSGKQEGSVYKCFRSPNGTYYWSLKKAKEAGFEGFQRTNSGQFTAKAGLVKKPSLKKRRGKGPGAKKGK